MLRGPTCFVVRPWWQGTIVRSMDNRRHPQVIRSRKVERSLRLVRISSEYRQRGVSAALMKALEDVARIAALSEIRLGVRASLPSNLRHYENLGYWSLDSSPYSRGSVWVNWLRKQVWLISNCCCDAASYG